MKTLYNLFPAILLCLGLTSCLKDDDILEDQMFGTNFVDTKNIVEFPGSTGSFRTSVVEVSDEPQVIRRVVRLAAANPLNEDITINLVVDQSALDIFNESVSDPTDRYSLVPTNAYTVEPAVIKAGQRDDTVEIKVITSRLDPTKNNALAFKLTTDNSRLTVSGNFGTALIGVAVPNVYDGEYEALGVFTHPTGGPRDIHEDKTVSTVNATTSETTLGDLGSSNYLMWLKVNPDNTVTLIPKGATPNISATGPNIYDPVQKAFILNYQYVPAGGAPRKVTETIKRK